MTTKTYESTPDLLGALAQSNETERTSEHLSQRSLLFYLTINLQMDTQATRARININQVRRKSVQI
jgi:hypothetical protein